MYLGKNNTRTPYNILNKQILESDEPTRDLGIYFTNNLSWGKHVEIITKKSKMVMFALIKNIKTNATYKR